MTSENQSIHHSRSDQDNMQKVKASP